MKSAATASLAGLESLKQSLSELSREQVHEDHRVEKPESLSWNAWLRRQSRQVARIESQIEKCQTSDELINTAATILKPWHLEAFLYLFVSDRDPSEPPLSIEFQKVIDTLHPKDDHCSLPEATERELLQVETELHDRHLEELFLEEFVRLRRLRRGRGHSIENSRLRVRASLTWTRPHGCSRLRRCRASVTSQPDSTASTTSDKSVSAD